MAISVSGSGTKYLYHTGAAVPTRPFTLSAWYYPTTLTAPNSYGVVSRVLAGAEDNHETLLAYDSGANYANALISRDGGSYSKLIQAGLITANNWYHTCGVFADSNHRLCTGGGTIYTDTGAGAPTGPPDTLRIGRDGSSSAYFEGYIAHVGLWNVALTDAEMQSLGKGFCPMLVRPESLVAYWPLTRETINKGAGPYSLDVWKNAYHMTEVNSPSLAPIEPPVILPVGLF